MNICCVICCIAVGVLTGVMFGSYIVAIGKNKDNNNDKKGVRIKNETQR